MGRCRAVEIEVEVLSETDLMSFLLSLWALIIQSRGHLKNINALRARNANGFILDLPNCFGKRQQVWIINCTTKRRDATWLPAFTALIPHDQVEVLGWS